jgi:hypothetical protein
MQRKGWTLMNRRSSLILSALALAALSLPANSQGAGTSTRIPAQVTFHSLGCDGYPSLITGDGPGDVVYTDGVDGVACGINSSSTSGDLLLQLWHTPRTLHYQMPTAASIPCVPPVVYPPPTPIPSDFYDPSFMGVGSIWLMVKGQTVPQSVWLTTHTIGDIKFTAKYNPSLGFCSLPVMVTRLSDTTWEVCSQAPDDLAVVVQSQKNQSVSAGYFNLPFRITIKTQW